MEQVTVLLNNAQIKKSNEKPTNDVNENICSEYVTSEKFEYVTKNYIPFRSDNKNEQQQQEQRQMERRKESRYTRNINR